MRLFCKFSKVDLFDLKPNCAHPRQERIELVCLWLFVTSPFFRDGWKTVNSSRIIYMIYDKSTVADNVQ